MMRERIFWFLGGVMAGVAAMALFRHWGTPDAIRLDARETQLVDVMGHPGSMTQDPRSPGTAGLGIAGPGAAAGVTGAGQIGSVADVTEKLAKRLNAQGGTPADWALLAQSYEFLGRGAEAAEARKHAGMPAAAPAAASAMPAPSFKVTPEGTALLAEAEKARIAHDYPKALEAYAKAARLDALNADAWANYADAAASTRGSLAGEPARYLDRALALDPRHPKALWLQASLQHEQKHYPQAVETWQRLAAVLPADSPDGRIIAANIAEDQRLGGLAAGGSAGVQTGTGQTGAVQTGTVQIQGTIDLDPKLRARVSAGEVLFVFARAKDSPGPPVAVTRLAVGQWPAKFTLDDSQAMMPQRKLSDFRAVTVEARISASGQPLAQAGDLHGITGTLDPKSGKPVRVVISEVVGP